MNPSPVELFVPQNLQTGDEIVGDRPLMINDDSDEFVAVSLAPASDAVSIAPAVVNPGGVFRLILKDRDALLKDFMIQCLGVYSGNIQEVPLHFILDKEDGNVTMSFEKEAYDLRLSTPLLEKEIALIKMSSVVPSWARFTLTGPLSEHFSAFAEGGVVVVSSIPCTDCLIDIPSQFSLLLTSNGPEPQATILNFSVENIQRLRFEYSYEADVEEGAHTFKKVVKLKAIGGKATYSLEDPSGLFSVHPKTGMLTVQHPEFVFIDTVGSSLTLTATATSGEQKAHTTVAIRILPKSSLSGFRFEQDEYKFTIPAGQRDAGQITISSGNNVMYRLSEGPQDLFDVTNGSIKYIGSFPKEDQRYLLLILAESKESPAAAVTRADVTVTGIGSSEIELVSPKAHTVTISAEKSKGATLKTVEVKDDDDNCNVEFSVNKVIARDYDGNVTELSKDILIIEKDGKKATLSLKDAVGNSRWVALETTVEASDAAHPLEPVVTSDLEVFITREEPLKKKSSPLSFVKTPVTVVIPTSLPKDSFVYQFRVSDPEATVAYSMDSSSLFSLNATSGTLTTIRKLIAGARETLSVTAKSENGFVSENLVIEVADPSELSPELNNRNIDAKVLVTDPIGTKVANISVLNNVNAEFSLEGSEVFTIDQQGSVTIASQLPSNTDVYVLLARAKGEHGYDDCQITVHVDLDAAKNIHFSQETNNVTVMQNILVNSYVTDMKLSEQGVLPVKYSISALEEEEQLLDIDDDGRITAREEFDSVSGRRTFQVAASDGKRRATADLILNVVPAFSCVPKFSSEENNLFFVKENEASGTLIGKVAAVPLDPKCEMKFFFWDGEMTYQETDFVRIDADSGEITAKMSFDYENTTSYSMVLGLRAGMRQTAQRASLLLVKDADDHPINFTQDSVTIEVSEASPVGSLLTTAKAKDGDESQDVFYVLRQDGEQFGVEKDSGRVRLTKPLDRETEDRYQFEIGASNSPNSTEDEIPVWTVVNVVVKDVNDNGPVFDHGHYEALLEKGALPGRHVTKVHAEDPDISENGATPTVFYSLEDAQFEYRGTSRPMAGFFKVDRKTGDVHLLEPVSDFVGGVFHLLIQGSDGLESTSKKGRTGLRVLVHDESDVVRAEIPRNPEFVEIEDVQNLTQSISNATGLRVLVKEVGYHVAEGVVLREVTNLKLVLFNRTNYEIVSADKAMAMMKMGGLKRKGPMPRIAKAQLPIVVQDAPMFPSPLLLVAFVFALLFVLATLLFSMLICHYRARYRREKHNFEDHKIIQDALEGPRHRLPVPPPISRPQIERDDDRLGYGSQVRKMSVGPDEPRSRS